MLPMVNPESLGAGNVPAAASAEPPVLPRTVERGVVVFDLDGTLLDDIKLISQVAADVLYHEFGTPPEEGRIHYLATTGMPFEAQLAQLYPDSSLEARQRAARLFHERKVREAYAYARPFPEVPRLLKTLERERWTLVVSTGAERETAELLLEREGIRIWFDGVLGSGQGTKREHLREYGRRYPGVPRHLVGDSRFDLEAAQGERVAMFARAATYPGWTLSPKDFRLWGAVWADFSLSELPGALAAHEKAPGASPGPMPRAGERDRKARGRRKSPPRRRKPRGSPSARRHRGGPGPRRSGRRLVPAPL